MTDRTDSSTPTDFASSTPGVPCFTSFDDMSLDSELLHGVYSHGFDKPSSIQQKAIVPLTLETDVIGQSQSGTGKTGAFVIGAIQALLNFRKKFKNNRCRVVILTPTRELADQVFKVAVSVSQYLVVKVVKCVGGTDHRQNIEELRRGCDLIVGTPGRVYDMLNRDALVGSDVELLVLDEADEMLDALGFRDNVYDILEKLPHSKVALFSATLPPNIMGLAEQFMKDPTKIIVKTEALTLEGIRQYYIAMENESWKLAVLEDIYNTISITSCVIFCNTRRRADILTKNLQDRNYTVACTHGSLESEERKKILEDFRNGTVRILISTDLLARGIDVQHVSVVINYDLPINLECYLHRIGRSGRFGRKGVAINFVCQTEAQRLKDIERFYDTAIEEMPSDISSLI